MVAIACLYLYGLGGVGALGPDEPRYLAIGRAMLQSGDFITPRLWGSPWFEKPPLLYWMIGIGTAAGLGPEECGRLPVALLSLIFLVIFFLLLRREFGTEAAAVSSVLLATSAGWIAFSELALTDLPLAVFYSLAVALALPLVRSLPDGRIHVGRFMVIGISLGIATLAKGLVPIALALPFFWFLRHWWRSWWLACLAGLASAMPWYTAIYLRDGRTFLEEFFWKHHFERLYSKSLLHVQPWWYYLPVVLAALFPWTPLFALLARQRAWDERRKFLASCFFLGLILFSISLNKLPGYILPLLPAAFALLGASIGTGGPGRSFRWWLLPSAILIGLLPLLARLLPVALEIGRLFIPHKLHIGLTEFFYMAAPVAAVFLARRSWAGILLVLCLVGGGFFVKIVSYPILDRLVSARGTWRKLQNVHGTICDDWLARDWEYGLALYRGEPYPICGRGRFDFALQSHARDTPILVRKEEQ
ncbi:MAG: glycosyltransferase family 39 protein [Acidobacteriota bacterium]|nr:glycosyltransferase family 39 protein [Acidobacteriota bacterium]